MTNQSDLRRIMYALSFALVGVGQTSISSRAGTLDVNWHTVDAGGGYSAGGDYELRGTIGQSDTVAMVGGDFQLQGGFWAGIDDAPCPGDLDHNGVVELADLAGFLAAFGSVGGQSNFNTAADLDLDNDVDLSDLAGMLAVFGTSCS